jgi:S1-C subfamily serine protease
VELGVPAGEKGVLVEAVREGGWAALAHLGDGDVILAVDGEIVGDVAALQKKMEGIAAARPQSVVLHVRRGFRTFFVEMQTGWEKST